MTKRSPYEVLAATLEAEIAILKQADAILKRHQPIKSAVTAASHPKAQSPRRSTNGSGQIMPVQVPKSTSLTFTQRRALTSYLIYQIVSASPQPIALADVLASLRTVQPKASSLTVASALRRGVIKRGPDFKGNHRVYVVGKVPAAFATQAG